MAYEGLTVEYYVKTAGDPPFIPGNCQAPTNSHDNPDNGNNTQRTAQCLKLSPDGVVVVAS
jgi:hypothetical protein